MAKSSTSEVLDELAQYFLAEGLGRFGGAPVRAQSYEPGGAGAYDPYTDTRLSRLVAAGLSERMWANTKKALDDLSAAHVEVLRLASAEREGYARVAAQLPRALEQGKRIAERLALAKHLDALHHVLRHVGVGGVSAAQRILEEEQRYRPRVGWREVQSATLAGIRGGEIDVHEEAKSRVDEAVHAYVAARDAIPRARRALQEREEKRRATLAASLRASREEKERARFEARLRRPG